MIFFFFKENLVSQSFSGHIFKGWFYFFFQEMKDENGRLYKLLSEKDFEIKQLKKKKNDEKTAVMGKCCTYYFSDRWKDVHRFIFISKSVSTGLQHVFVH